MSEMDDLIQEFLAETFENLEQADLDMVALESDPENKELLSSVFRTVHTIKGTCGFLGYSKLDSLTHSAESLLARLRDGEMVLDETVTNAILATIDAVREILSAISSDGSEGDGDYSALIETLELLTGGVSDALEHDPVPEPDIPEPALPEPASNVQQEALKEDDHYQERRRRKRVDGTLRVDIGLIDRLMSLVGELVLTRNQLMRFALEHRDKSFVDTSQRLDQVTAELQEGVMKTRMQPIGSVWSKAPRIVRDLAVATKKKVKLVVEGEATELDKTVIEAIKDPLVHMIRNCVDHGIEAPEDRLIKGKPEEGTLTLRAFHEGGNVQIEISDDGRGFETSRIRERAIANGMITAREADAMGRHEIDRLVFAPGFSTARTISSISGRGVGMDDVKTNVEQIGGTIDLENRPGRGMTIRLKIPLTLAIIPALMVMCAGERFAVPQAHLMELVCLEDDEESMAIEVFRGAPVCRLRGHLVPLVYLRKELGVENAPPPVSPLGKDHSMTQIAVLEATGRLFGLVIDQIGSPEEIVVKPLGRQLSGIGTFAGATIMGDGSVALILDVVGLAQRASVVTDAASTIKTLQPDARPLITDRGSYLLVDVEGGRRGAIPISMIDRLEVMSRASIEKASEGEVVQYRGGILPLRRLSAVLGWEPADRAPRANIAVVVHSSGGRLIGYVVDGILDIVDEEVLLHSPATTGGVLGATVIQERVADVLDLAALTHRMRNKRSSREDA